MIWIVFGAMVALTVLVLLRPLLSKAAPLAARADYDLMVYKDQLGEIGRDIERGLMTEEQAASARTEIQRRMLAAAESGKAVAPGAKGGKLAAVAIALGLPLLSLAVYLAFGAPGLPDRPYAERAAQIAEMKEKTATIQGMVARLADRLSQNPEDGKGWAMLGRSYRALGRIDEAKEAHVKAIALLPGEVQARIEYAVLLLDEAEGDALPVQATNLMEEVLALAPDQPDALYFVGLAAAQKGDSARARTLWARLLVQLPAESPARAQVQQSLDSLK